MPNFTGILAGLSGFPQGLMEAQKFQQDQQYRQALQALAQQQIKEAQQKALMQGYQQEGMAGLAGAFGPGGPFGGGAVQPSQGQPDTVQQQSLSAPPQQQARLPVQQAQALTGKYESGDRYNVGYGGQDLSKTPLGPTGFPQWPGRQGPQGMTHASGRYQFEPATWDRYAGQAGVKDFSPASQDKVFGAAYQAEGMKPWASNPQLMAAVQNVAPQAQQAAQAAARSIPQQNWGRSTVIQLAQAIEQVSPGISPIAKVFAMQEGMKLLAPEERMQFQAWAQDKKLEIQAAIAEFHAQTTQRGQDIHAQTTERGQDIKIASQGAGGGEEKLAASKMLEITNKQTGETRSVMAREHKGSAGWIDSMTGQPLQIAPGETVKEVTASTSGGGRAGAQVQRQLTGAAEVKTDLQNVANMPVGTTTGMFGMFGSRPATSMTGALKADLATQLTTEDEGMMQSAMAGFTRELSTLMSPVYGGNYASEQLQPLMPRAGMTVLNSMYNIARIKQTATNAIQSLLPSPILNDEQKKYARDLSQTMEEAIPWSPQDVIAFKQNADPQVTFGQFAKKSGIQGAAAGQGGGGYSIGQVIEKGGKKYRVTGGDPSDPDVEPVQ